MALRSKGGPQLPGGVVLRTEGDNVCKYTWQVSGSTNITIGEKH